MKILFVWPASSIHTAKWLSQFKNTGFELYLFPSEEPFNNIHPDIKNNNNIIVLDAFEPQRQNDPASSRPINGPGLRAGRLASYIENLKPDIIHSLGFKQGCCLVMEARKKYNRKFPFWIISSSSADIYLFGRLSCEQDNIIEILYNSDYYMCECNSDNILVRFFGFLKEKGVVSPLTSGFDIETISKLKSPEKTSERRLIMFKGCQGWDGNSLFGLRALERCKDVLKGFEVCIYSSGESREARIAVELFSKTGIQVRIIPDETTHKELLRYYGNSRISIGLSVTDAIGTSFLEPMAMGSFPIQSFTPCSSEWLKNEENGILVHPEDTDAVEKAIRKSLSDDIMVDNAGEINFTLVKERLEFSALKNKAVYFYNTIFEKFKSNTYAGFAHQKINISDLPLEFNLITRREILLKEFQFLYRKNDYESYSALVNNLEILIDSDPYTKEMLKTMEFILIYAKNYNHDNASVKEILDRIEKSTLEKKLLPLAYKIVSEAAFDRDLKTYFVCKFKGYAFKFEAISQISEIDEILNFLNNQETKNLFDSLKTENNGLNQCFTRVKEAYINTLEKLNNPVLESKISNIYSVVFKETNAAEKFSDTKNFNAEDFTSLYINKKIEFFRNFILYSLFYLSRKSRLDSFLNLKNIIAEILKVDDYLNNNFSLLEYCTQSSAGVRETADDFIIISNLIEENLVSKQFLPLYYQCQAEKFRNIKDKYFAARFMELAAKIAVDSISFSEYDIEGKPDGFLIYLCGPDFQKYLYEKQKIFLEKALSAASTDLEISAIQNRIQQLYKLSYNIK